MRLEEARGRPLFELLESDIASLALVQDRRRVDRLQPRSRIVNIGVSLLPVVGEEVDDLLGPCGAALGVGANEHIIGPRVEGVDQIFDFLDIERRVHRFTSDRAQTALP